MAYYLEMRDGVSTQKSALGGNEIDGPPSQKTIRREIRAWVTGGSWGDEGASIDIMWELTDEDGDTVDNGTCTVEVKPNHEALIRAAGGNPDCEHDWTSAGEGGLDENPGIWSLGGTAISYAAHCTKCGLHRMERHTGSQRNPGEHDTVAYEQPAAWCAACQRENCDCQREDQE